MSGIERTIEELKALYRTGVEVIGDPLQISRLTYLDLDEPFRSINHSCQPNLGLRGGCEIIALSDIATGEEVFFDYSTTMWEEGWDEEFTYSWVMPCHCRNPKCRGMVADFPTLPLALKEHYRSQGALMDFILEKWKQYGP